MCFIFQSHIVLFEKQGENRNYCSEPSKAVISSLPKKIVWIKCYLQDLSNCLFLLASKEQMVNSKLWIVLNPFQSQLNRSHAQSFFFSWLFLHTAFKLSDRMRQLQSQTRTTVTTITCWPEVRSVSLGVVTPKTFSAKEKRRQWDETMFCLI